MTKRSYALGLLGVFCVLGLWSLATAFALIYPLYAPTPWSVAAAFPGSVQALAGNTIVSLTRLIQGFVIGATLGIFVGVMLGSSSLLDEVLRPIIDLFRSIPNLAWVPVALIWFGIGSSSEVYVISLAVFFILFTNTYQGIKTIDPLLIRAALSLGASESTMLYRVRLKAALGDIFIGLRLGIQNGIVAMVASEILASTSGLGFMMDQASSFFKTQVVLLDMLEIGFMGWLFTMAFTTLQKRYMRWHSALATR